MLPKITEESATPTGSKISIARLLDIVNETYSDILPKEALNHYGHNERLTGKLGNPPCNLLEMRGIRVL